MNKLLSLIFWAAGGYLVYETGKVIGGVGIVNKFKQNPALLSSFGIQAGCPVTKPATKPVAKATVKLAPRKVVRKRKK